MELPAIQSACPWCGREVLQPAIGRPRVYCRDSHRQRAYEARRMGWHLGLDSDEAIISVSGLDDLGDRLTVLEAAIEDVQQDLRAGATGEDYQAAFRHLFAAAVGLQGRRLKVRAIGRRP